jgi:hypothetical protein
MPPVVLDDEVTDSLEKENTIPSPSNEGFNWWMMNKTRVTAEAAHLSYPARRTTPSEIEAQYDELVKDIRRIATVYIP